MGSAAQGVLVLALGAPDSLDNVGPYLHDVRGGRPTPPEMVEEFRARYARIGGRSPLVEISRAQAGALEQRLRGSGRDVRVYLAMRHGRPRLPDVVAGMVRDGIHQAVGLCLTPYYSKASVGAYAEAVERAVDAGGLDLVVRFVESWNDLPALSDAFAAKVEEGRGWFARAGDSEPVVVFTAHSLPQSVIDSGDPYERELRETMGLILARLPSMRSRLAFQSAGRTPAPWLGPPLESVLEELAAEGERAVLLVPFGFVSDHLEILYDLDVDARELAERLRIHLERTGSLNTDPKFVEAMEAAVGPLLDP